ncbi:MAG: acyl-protein synthetase [Sandaracinaceae bacterium]
MSDATRDALRARILELIDRLADGSRDEPALSALLADLAAYQTARVAPYARLCAAGGDRALPTDVFRFARIASFPPGETQKEFRTSGTTHGERGVHPFASLELYDRAAHAAARHALFCGVDRMRLVILAPSPREAPDSSLSYMLGRFETWFGTRVDWVWRDQLDLAALDRSLLAAHEAREPVALLGTSFAFIHAEDALGERRYALPSGSRIMQTGGTKGRSREVSADALTSALAVRYGVPEPFVVAEYSMTELSSQMYERTLRDAYEGRAPIRRYWVPGWVRATATDPETLGAARGIGVLRIDDAANLDSVSAVQTADLARVDDDGLELLGRAPGAVPRGCSLAIEEALGG